MHLGATHREVQKYLPEIASNLKPMNRSPAKSAKTPLRGPTPDPSQKFLANLMKGQPKSPATTESGKKTSPKSGTPKGLVSTELPQLADEFMS